MYMPKSCNAYFDCKYPTNGNKNVTIKNVTIAIKLGVIKNFDCHIYIWPYPILRDQGHGDAYFYCEYNEYISETEAHCILQFLSVYADFSYF